MNFQMMRLEQCRDFAKFRLPGDELQYNCGMERADRISQNLEAIMVLRWPSFSVNGIGASTLRN